MAEVPQLALACGERRSGHGFASRHVGGEGVERDLVDVGMRVGVVAEIGAGVEPQVEHLPQAIRAPVLPSFVHEPDHRDLLLAKRGQELTCHLCHRRLRAGAAVAAAGQVVDRDRDRSSRALYVHRCRQRNDQRE